MGRVLIIFQANSEAMEQLALAVAVGAVEAEGAIRLRRLAAADAPELAHKSYGRLQEDDLRWADVIVAGRSGAVVRDAAGGGSRGEAWVEFWAGGAGCGCERGADAG
jgi:hypothetical protein